MKIQTLKIHNFRSIKDVTINLDDYSLLIGENNVGKTNIITALRLFYEDEGIKYNESTDFPKFQTEDNESWIEIEFFTTNDEQQSLKEEYRSNDNILKVRKYFKSDIKGRVNSNQSNIYAYENGILSDNLFYGARNISQSKLGKVIYIPDICKTDDTLKLSGPSPFRNMVNFVMKKLVKNSAAFKKLGDSFEDFNIEFKEESSVDGFSLQSMTDEINKDLKNWGIKFNIDINPVKPDDIVKNLLSHYIEDDNFNGQKVSINSYGQGLQRHLIYTLIKLSASYVDKNSEKKKDFSPDFTLILFEEPEAFLHPSQQECLNISLRQLASESQQQVLVTTHSPVFVCKNIFDLTCLIRLQKKSAVSVAYQLRKEDIDNLFNDNISLFSRFSIMLSNPSVSQTIKEKIRRRNLGEQDLDEEKKLEEESLRFFLWLDNERASLFFAKHIIICEGASEKVLFDYLTNTTWTDLIDKHIYFLDSIGKFNIHRYMNLFGKLGISHSVIMDSDKDKDIHDIINDFITSNKNEFTKSIFSFEDDIEGFLGIKKPPSNRNDLKPLNILYQYKTEGISPKKIIELRKLLDQLV